MSASTHRVVRLYQTSWRNGLYGRSTDDYVVTVTDGDKTRIYTTTYDRWAQLRQVAVTEGAGFNYYLSSSDPLVGEIERAIEARIRVKYSLDSSIAYIDCINDSRFLVARVGVPVSVARVSMDAGCYHRNCTIRRDRRTRRYEQMTLRSFVRLQRVLALNSSGVGSDFYLRMPHRQS